METLVLNFFKTINVLLEMSFTSNGDKLTFRQKKAKKKLSINRQCLHASVTLIKPRTIKLNLAYYLEKLF